MRSAHARAAARAAAIVACVAVLQTGACAREPVSPHGAPGPSAARPSILLVTLDTTRADAIGPEAAGIRTPSFNAIAARGHLFRQAYATVPETLPSHVSMLTGLYPAGHGIHENGRSLSVAVPVVAERLRQAGYQTAAVVSSFVLARRFGLARGFDAYDDGMPEGREDRTAREVTDAAIAALAAGQASAPRFLWVHYWDPHHPYAPPEPFRNRFPKHPYLGEVAYMDAELGRLTQAFEQRAGSPVAVILVGDHGEGLGEHGEYLHGNLVYQSTMHVPLAVMGPGVEAGASDAPVSTRRVYHTILDWAGLGSEQSLRRTDAEVVLGEAMKPFLNYGWQPQVMAVDGRHKSILAGRLEVYDVILDPGERRDVANERDRPLVPAALRDYPAPSPSAARPPGSLDPEAQKTLASLGYVSAGAAPMVRKDAPRPADMTALFEPLERASGLFVAERYAQVIPLLEKILSADPYNVDAVLRLATSHSSLGHGPRAVALFQKAAALAPQSPDVRMYLGLHYARGAEWPRAVPLLEQVVADTPDRLSAVEALAAIRERQGRVDEAVSLWRRMLELRTPRAGEWTRLGRMAMEAGKTDVAIDAFERARASDGTAFTGDLELGLLYMNVRRLEDARAALDRVPPAHGDYAVALYKRAQLSVLLGEPDRAQRIVAARRGADSRTRDLVANDRLFRQ